MKIPHYSKSTKILRQNGSVVGFNMPVQIRISIRRTRSVRTAVEFLTFYMNSISEMR
jgi:hypothetical protein